MDAIGEASIERRFRARHARCGLPLVIALAIVGAGLSELAWAESASFATGRFGSLQNPSAEALDPPAPNGNGIEALPPAEPMEPAGNSDRQRHAASVMEYIKAPPALGNQLVNLKTNLLEVTDLPYPISLASALQLSDARPLVVAAAQASAWVAEAQYQRAKVIKVPELDFGVIYVRHDGEGPDFNHGVSEPTFTPGIGGILKQDLNWMYIGGSFFMQVPLTDAIFAPLAARQVLNARRFGIQTAKNDALLSTARAYFLVHRFRGQYAGATDVVERGEKLTARIEQLSKDIVPRIEVDRSERFLADAQQHAALARQQWRVASANLTQVLRLDPRVVVEPLEHDHLQITMIDPARPLDELMPIALTNRPELQSQKALIQAAEVKIRQEKNRPLLPYVLLTGFQSPGQMRMQGMIFGLGPGSKMDQWSLREDVSLQLVWQLEGMGFGNLARIKQQRGEESEAIVMLRRMQDAIVAEITQAQADVQSAAVRVLQAERSLREALITFDGNYEGLAQTQRFDNVLIQVYRPQEAVRSLENLMVSYDQYFGTVADYNRAQFDLFHALGYPAREVSALHSPGVPEAVDTSRPGYLPDVRPGPPPATR